MLKTKVIDYKINIKHELENYFKNNIINIFKENNIKITYNNNMINSLEFIKNDYTGDEIRFFNKVAKYIDKNSYIIVEGNNNGHITHWKYQFDGFKCMEMDI